MFHDGAGIIVRGNIASRNTGPDLLIQLDGMEGRLQTPVGTGGTFQFDGVPPGMYDLTVMSFRGDVIHRESLDARGSVLGLTIHLPEQRPAQAEPPSTVSVSALRHKPNKKARNEHDKGVKELNQRHWDKAIAHLKKAAALDPEYADAFTDLGVTYIRKKQNEDALAAFEKSLELDPNAPVTMTNASATLLILNRFPEAERIARQAMGIDPTNAGARYCLASALLGQNKSLPEAMQYLTQIADQLPSARLLLAEAQIAQGLRKEAVVQLQKYLDSGKQTERNQAESLLMAIREQEQPVQQ